MLSEFMYNIAEECCFCSRRTKSAFYNFPKRQPTYTISKFYSNMTK